MSNNHGILPIAYASIESSMKSWLRNIAHYRFFITSSIRNELLNQFARSRLGGLWMLIQPLMMVAIYAFVLSQVLSAKFDGIDNSYAYAIYLTAGILCWTFFSDVMTRCLGLFAGQADLLKKMVVPKITLPMIMAGTTIVNYLILFVVILLIFGGLGHYPSIHILWMPVLTFVLLLFAFSLGLIAAVLNVFVRDIGHLVPVLLQFLFWFTPIVYPVTIIPENMRGLIEFNPVYPLVSAFQDVLAYQQTPDLVSLLRHGIIGLLLLCFAVWLVRRASDEMVDVL